MYPQTEGGDYWNHHTHKVPHEDYRETPVEEITGGRYRIIEES
jgi:hypothetical protein